MRPFAVVLLCVACGPAYTWRPSAGTPAARISASQVTLYEPTDDEILPRGIRRNRSGIGLTIDPPHRLIGTIVGDCRKFDWVEKSRQAMLDDAARHGADALIYTGDCACAAVATSTAPAPSASALLEQQAARAVGLERVAVESRRLERFEPVRLTAKRGRCFAVGYALAGDAALVSTSSLGLNVSWIGVPWENTDDVVLASGWSGGADHVTLATAPAGGIEALADGQLCPSADRELEIDLRPQPAAGVALGRGEVKVVVYARTIAAAELENEIAKQRERRAKNDLERSVERLRGCAICGAHTQECRARGATSREMIELCNEYYRCLQSHGASAAVCPD
jgi:hypothetical protein